MILATNIKIIRELWGLNQTQMGYVLGATKGMIQTYEADKASPKSNLIAKLEAISGVGAKSLQSEKILEEDISQLPRSFKYLAGLVEDYLKDRKLKKEIEKQISIAETSNKKGNKQYYTLQEKNAVVSNRMEITSRVIEEFDIHINWDLDIDLFNYWPKFNVPEIEGTIRKGRPQKIEPDDISNLKKLETIDNIKIIPFFDTNANLYMELGGGKEMLPGIMKKYSFRPLVVPGLEDCDFAISLWGYQDNAGKPGFSDILICKYIGSQDLLQNVKYGVLYIAITNDDLLMLSVKDVDGAKQLVYSEGKGEENQKQLVFNTDLVKSVCMVNAWVSRV